MNELIIGSHVSFKKDSQLKGSVLEAISYGSNALMIYTGAPQNTNRAAISDELTYEGMKLLKENDMKLENVIVHAPYIINLANNTKNFEFAVDFLKEELRRCSKLGIRSMVLHPGSHVKLGVEIGLANIIKGLKEVCSENIDVKILLETMAGKGTELGTSFEQLAHIINEVNSDKIGVCLDTCHTNDAGYDISNFDLVLDEFDEKIGLSKLGCIHVNDSKNERGASKDRHENFGLGYLGFDTLINVIYNERIKNVPKILETPYVTKTDEDKKREYPPYKFEIEMIKNKKFNPSLIKDIRNYYK